MNSKLTTKLSTEHETPPIVNVLLPAGRLKERILLHLQNRNGYFTAADIAREIGYPLNENGYFDSCPNVRRVLTKLCKEGKLYQWITGNGMSPSAISNTPKYNVNYLKVESDLANTLLNHPNRELVGYRIR